LAVLRAPGKWVCGGAKIFGFALLHTATARNVCVSERCFIFPLVRVIFGAFTQMLQRQEGHLACKNGVGLLAKVISPELCMSKLYTTVSIISCRGKNP